MLQSPVGARMGRGRRAVGVLMLWAAAIGCGRPAPPPSRYLQVDIETSPTATDPRFATDAVSSRINELIFDSLVKVDRNGRFVGDLAESIERPDDTHIIFHLKSVFRVIYVRERASRDVKFTYVSVRDPSSASPKRAGLNNSNRWRRRT